MKDDVGTAGSGRAAEAAHCPPSFTCRNFAAAARECVRRARRRNRSFRGAGALVSLLPTTVSVLAALAEELHMLHRCLALVLAVALSPASGAAGVPAQDAQALEQVKSKVARLGVGERARATVRMKDGRKLKGYIAESRETEFVLRDRKTDAPTIIPYTDVAKVESNRGHSTARNVALGVGIGVGAVILTVALIVASLDD
jgi:hypothetical protein